MQFTFADLADTYVAGLAAVINGTHPVGSTYTGTTDAGSDAIGAFCRAKKDVRTETADVTSLSGGCTEDCTNTSDVTGNFYRITGRTRSVDDPLTQTKIEVDLDIWGWSTICIVGVPITNGFYDRFSWSKTITTVNCEDMIATLVYDGTSRGGATPSCTTLQLDAAIATCEVSILTTVGP